MRGIDLLHGLGRTTFEALSAPSSLDRASEISAARMEGTQPPVLTAPAASSSEER